MKHHLYYILLVGLFSLLVVSCSDNDSKDSSPTPAAGTTPMRPSPVASGEGSGQLAYVASDKSIKLASSGSAGTNLTAPGACGDQVFEIAWSQSGNLLACLGFNSTGGISRLVVVQA